MEKAVKSAKHPPFPSRMTNLRFPRQDFVPIHFRAGARMGYEGNHRRGASFYLPIQVRCTKCPAGLRSWLGLFQQGSSVRPLLAISCFYLITNELSGGGMGWRRLVHGMKQPAPREAIRLLRRVCSMKPFLNKALRADVEFCDRDANPSNAGSMLESEKPRGFPALRTSGHPASRDETLSHKCRRARSS